MVNNLGPIDRVGAGGLDAVGNEFPLFKNLGRHSHLKKMQWHRLSTPSRSIQKTFSPLGYDGSYWDNVAD